MNNYQTRKYEMLVRVSDFGNTYGNLLSKKSVARGQFDRVAKAITQIAEHNVAKLSAVREGKTPKAMARIALLRALLAIRRTARTMVEDTAGLDDKFRLAPDPGDQALLTTARMFVQDAEAFTAQFIAHGMPATFVKDLTERIDAFEQAIRDREAGKSERAAARTGIGDALSSGMSAARKLDAIIRNQVKDSMAIAAWTRDRRIVRGSRSKTEAATTTPASPESHSTPVLAPVTTPVVTAPAVVPPVPAPQSASPPVPAPPAA